MSDARFVIDKQSSSSTAMEVPAFPWIRADASQFIWEEAFYKGNYFAVHHSAIGRCQSKESIYSKIEPGRFPKDHLLAFEVELDGELLRDGFEWKGEQQCKSQESFEDLAVTLTFDSKPVTVTVHTRLDGSSFLKRWLEIRNEGNAPLRLSRVYPWAGIIAADELGMYLGKQDGFAPYVLGRFRFERWSMEGDFEWISLSDGQLALQSHENKHHPSFFAVRNSNTGEMTLLLLECTSPTEVSFTQAVEPRFPLHAHPWGGRYVYAKAGPWGRAPLRVLEPGEVVTTPAVHLGMVQGDLDAGVNALYEHLRRSVIPSLPPERENLVEYNHTGYTMNAQVSKDLLRKEVDVAAEIGAELFVVDAGWFGPKDAIWSDCFGDWFENPILGEGGLRDVFDYARGLGMRCGLWMPPEMAAFKSDVARKHPDWFLRGAQDQYLTFDVLNPEVEQYVFNTICDLVSCFNLDCFRIDGGTSNVGDRLLDNGSRESLSWRYYDRLFAIYRRVRKRFPDLIMENCSGGGGRCDPAMMRYFNYTQISDNWAPDDQVRILNGMTLALTPAQCMPLVGSINLRAADIDFVIRTGLFGHFAASGVFPGMQKINPPALERWKHGIELYKSVVRPLIPMCRVFHHTPIQPLDRRGDWVVLEYASAERDAAVVGLFRLTGPGDDTFNFVARGLDPAREYSVTFDNSLASVRMSGTELVLRGIPVRLPSPLTSQLLIIGSA